MKITVILIVCIALGAVNITAKPSRHMEKETKRRNATTILTKTTKALIHKSDSKNQRFPIKHLDKKILVKNRTEDNLMLKNNNISEKELFEHVTGKENDIDERALVFIEQRYKVPFLHPVQQKHIQRNHQVDYRTFLSNTDSNDDVRQVFLHKFHEGKRQHVKSHKDIYMGDKSKKYYEDVYLKEYENNNLAKSYNDDDPNLKYNNYRNKKKKVNIINSNLGHKYNDNSLKDDLVNMDMERYSGDPIHNHDRLMREQLISLKDHYRRAQDHESREKQLLNDIQAIKANIDTISAEHRQYLELLKTQKRKETKTNSGRKYQMNSESRPQKVSPQDVQIRESKVIPSITQYYAPPTSMSMKSSPKDAMIIDSVPVEKEPGQQQPQQVQPALQPTYLNSPPDIDFHDSRILSKIDEMNSLSASMEKEKRSSASTATFIGSSSETNRTTRASEIKNSCVYPDCLRNWRPSSKNNETCDCKQETSSSESDAEMPKLSTSFLYFPQL